jgi:putative component of membrane protein insertase Oxa1/YidC/SpoIIIJ protein YidD
MLGNAGSWMIKVLWQQKLGPWHKERKNVICRYHPSCSSYGRLAMEKFGLYKGAKLTYARIQRCVPETTTTCIDFP